MRDPNRLQESVGELYDADMLYDAFGKFVKKVTGHG